MDDSSTRPRRGRPARISRKRIVDAARGLSADAITMQAVAQVLGVERQSLSYHVRDRDELLGLVAASELVDRARTLIEEPPDRDWRASSRAFAAGVRAAAIATGMLSLHLRPNAVEAPELFLPAENVMAAFFDAGLDERTAVAAVNTLLELAIGAGRNAINAESGGREATASIERDILAQRDERLPALRRAAAAHLRLDPDEQFAFDLDVLLLGIGALVARSAGGGGGAPA
ncbi:TetR/AcrR family transcriptional regulator C-terminal domain-containing protein [Gryllotalpicola reticulitermitis]|uniref:TetR/AcrR family transcriptional regulator C-terminal domain-containing protein n=1 Tax=Gryllotalpicola reticulitermitis TaxID=1184153 RepID=A0ABV8Q5A3_9MICO